MYKIHPTNNFQFQEEGLSDAQAAITVDYGPDSSSVLALKNALEIASNACSAYVRHMANAPPFGNTKLDKERQKLCIYEIVS